MTQIAVKTRTKITSRFARSTWILTSGEFGKTASNFWPLCLVTNVTIALTIAPASNGQRRSHRCRRSPANAIATSTVSGTRTTSAWTTRGCRGSPLNVPIPNLASHAT